MSLINKILIEAKQRGVLYHFTSISRAYFIVKQDTLNSSLIKVYNGDTDNQGVSLTRDKMFHKTANRVFDGITSVDVRITLDGNKLSNKYKIVPFNFWYKDRKNLTNAARPENTESEELVMIKNKIGIKPVIPYILKIDVLNYDSSNSGILNLVIEICKENNIEINY